MSATGATDPGNLGLAALKIHFGKVVQNPRKIPAIAVFFEQIGRLLVPSSVLIRIVTPKSLNFGAKNIGKPTHVATLLIRPL